MAKFQLCMFKRRKNLVKDILQGFADFPPDTSVVIECEGLAEKLNPEE